MPYASLREFIDRLEAGGLLKRIAHPVSPVLEMTEIQRRLLRCGRAGGGCSKTWLRRARPFPIRCWSTSSAPSSASPLGMDRKPEELREVGETLAFLRQPEPPGGLREAMGMLPLAKKVLSMKPKDGARGAVPGGGADRGRHRPRDAADPDLLARRAGAADHLAAGRHPAAPTPRATAPTSPISASTGCRSPAATPR